MQFRTELSSFFPFNRISKVMAVKRFLEGTFLLLLLSYPSHGQNQQSPRSKFLPSLFTTIQATMGSYSPFSYIPRPVGPFPANGYRPGDVNFAYSYPFVQHAHQQPALHFTGPTRTRQKVPTLQTPPFMKDEVRQQPPPNLSSNSENGVAKQKHPAPPPPLAMLPPSIDNRHFHDVRLIQPPSVVSSENRRKEIPLEKFHKPVFVDSAFGNSNARKSVTPPSVPAIPLKSDNVFIRHKNPQGGYSSETSIVNTKHVNVSNYPVQPTSNIPEINKRRRPFDNFKPIRTRPKPFPRGKPVYTQLTENRTPASEVPRRDSLVNFVEDKPPKSTTQVDPLFTSDGMSYSTFVKLPDKHANTKTPTVLKEVTQVSQEEPSLSPYSSSKENIEDFTTTTEPEINPETSSVSVTSELPDEHKMAITETPSPPREEQFVSGNIPLFPPETMSVLPPSEMDQFDETSPFGNWAFGDNKVLTGTPEEILTLKLADAINNFGFELYRKLQGTNNPFFSPLSLSAALAIILEGTSNMTAIQMMNSLHFSESNILPDEVKASFKRLMKSLKSKRLDYQFENANLLLLQDKFAFKSEFSNTVYKHYKPLLGSVDFAADGLNIKRNVNDWVKRRTHGKIDEFLREQLPPETICAILNAVYFRGQWLHPFDALLTGPALFYNYGKDPTEVTMMKQISSFPVGYSEYLNSQIIELPYEGEETSMVIILPEERDGIYKLKNKLNYQELYVILSEIDFQTVQLSLPRFSLRSRYDMEYILKEMGMRDAFIPGKANFSRMTNIKGVYLSKVSHEGVIDVDEKGTEAAASTGGFVVPLSRPRLVNVDHPFFFFIRNRNNGAILFIGQFDAFNA